MTAFPLTLAPDDNGTFLVTCPALPEVTTFGETEAEALAHGAEAVEEAVGARMARWEDIPVPTRDNGPQAILPLQTAMKLALFRACKEADVTRAELARRMGAHREQVDRLFRIDHASRIDQIDAALAAIGKRLDVEVAA